MKTKSLLTLPSPISWGSTFTDAYWALYLHILFSDKPKRFKNQKLTVGFKFQDEHRESFHGKYVDSNLVA